MNRIIERIAAYGSGLLTIALLLGTTLLATSPVSTPEVDGSTLSAGFAVLAAGALILRARFRK